MNDFQCYLLSFPRSGNHWVRYILEYFSGRPTIGDGQTEMRTDWTGIVDSPIFIRVPELNVNSQALPIAFKRHFINEDNSDKNIPVIIILRNYKEVFMRSMQEHMVGWEEPLNTLAIVQKYMNLINEFELCKTKKLVIYYEDLMQYPEENIKKILKFCKLSTDKLYNFLENYDKHTKSVLSMYSKTVAKTQTDGNLALHYSLGLMSDVKFAIDEAYRNYGKIAYDKYFKKYAEKI